MKEKNQQPLTDVQKMKNQIIRDGQIIDALQKFVRQFHNLSFGALVELYKIDPDNRFFYNGYVSPDFMEKIKLGAKVDQKDLPKEAFEKYQGDMKPGIPPEAITRIIPPTGA